MSLKGCCCIFVMHFPKVEELKKEKIYSKGRDILTFRLLESYMGQNLKHI